jgi:hypothetical protein
MYSVKRTFLLGIFLSFAACHAVKVADVQKLTVNNFFGTWSKFLDQVLQEQKEQISPENNKIYQAFIQQAKKLNIPKVTGNKNSITGMQEQMKGVQQRVGGEKKVEQDWKQLSETIANAAQPISQEHTEAYQTLIKQAKSVGLTKKELNAMEAKMKELQDKLGVINPQSKIPAPVMAPETLVKKEEPKEEHAPVHHEERTPESVHEEKPEQKPVS